MKNKKMKVHQKMKKINFLSPTKMIKYIILSKIKMNLINNQIMRHLVIIHLSYYKIELLGVNNYIIF